MIGQARTPPSSGHQATIMPELRPVRLISSPAAGTPGNSRRNLPLRIRKTRTPSDLPCPSTGTRPSLAYQWMMMAAGTRGQPISSYAMGSPGDSRRSSSPQDLVGFDLFGGAVFVHGNTAVVGASGHSHSGLRFPGAAYVFVREGTTWVEQAKLTADDAASSDSFGKSVALFNNTIIVGAPSG